MFSEPSFTTGDGRTDSKSKTFFAQKRIATVTTSVRENLVCSRPRQ